MELERQLQRRFENAPVVPAPDEEGGVENAAVHADGTVKLGIHDGGGTDDHTVGEIMVLAALRRLTRQAQIIGNELRQAGRVRNVAGGDLAVPVLHDGIHRQGVISQQVATHRERIELPDLLHRPADAPAQQHVEFQPFLPAEPDKGRHIQRFEKGHHGVGRVHPEGVSLCPRGGFGIDDDRLHRVVLRIHGSGSSSQKSSA